MPEKPDIREPLIISRIRIEPGLDVSQVAFLPFGNDSNTSFYVGETQVGKSCIFDAGKGHIESITVMLSQ